MNAVSDMTFLVIESSDNESVRKPTFHDELIVLNRAHFKLEALLDRADARELELCIKNIMQALDRVEDAERLKEKAQAREVWESVDDDFTSTLRDIFSR